MTRYEQLAVVDNRPHQAELAATLVATLGLQGAIHACQANAWNGVLECVLARGGNGYLERS